MYRRRSTIGPLITLALIMLVILIPILFTIAAFLKKSSGVSVGKIVDVSREGILIETCEVDLQYGDQSSRIESFSTPNLIACDELKDMVGKNLKVSYTHGRFQCFFCTTNDIIKEYEIQ